MGAKQSKRSVDISATPKKGENGLAAAVVGDTVAKIEEGDMEGAVKTVANGVSTHGVEKVVEEVTDEVKEEVKNITEVSRIFLQQ